MKQEELKTLCVYCNEFVNNKGLSNHLKHKHDTNFKDYLKLNLNLFPDYHMCPICNINPCVANKTVWPGTCSNECSKIMRSEKRTGTKSTISPERRLEINQNISFAKKGKPTGINCLERMTPEAVIIRNLKISNFAKTRIGYKNPNFGKKFTPEHIHKIFANRSAKTNIEKMMSSFLDEYQIEYYFQFFINDESTHSYDFKIKGIPLIIETDGDYWHGGPGCKNHFYKVDSIKEVDVMKTNVANKNGYTVLRFWQSDMQNNFNYIRKVILNEINVMRNKNE